MGLLRPYEQRNAKADKAPDKATDTPVDADGATDRQQHRRKKGPTPTRAEAEKARMERLHPTMTRKQAKKAAAAARMSEREQRWAVQQNTPEKVLMRDYVDARWTITEFLLPVMLVLVAVSFLFARSPLVQSIILGVMVFLLVAWVLNVWWAWRGFKQEAVQRLRNPNFRGVLMEMNSRMMSIRRFRNPGPRINRGDAY